MLRAHLQGKILPGRFSENPGKDHLPRHQKSAEQPWITAPVIAGRPLFVMVKRPLLFLVLRLRDLQLHLVAQLDHPVRRQLEE